jgi:hypothetical protein
MLKAIMSVFTHIFERDPQQETCPQLPRRAHPVTARILGTTLYGGSSVNEEATTESKGSAP